MFKVYALVFDRMNILCKKNISTGKELCLELPFAISTSKTTAENRIKNELKVQGIGIAYNKEIFTNGNESAITTFLNYHSTNDVYVWCPISEFVNLQYIDCNIFNEIKRYLNCFIQIEKEFRTKINNVFNQKEVTLQISFSVDAASVFIRHKEVFCPFVFTVEYEIENGGVNYIVRWRVNKQPGGGENEDIVFLFLTTMSTILKIVGENSWIFAYDNLGLLDEINTGEILLECFQKNAEISVKDFADTIIEQFAFFNFMMTMHGALFGSIDNRIKEKTNCSNIEHILSHFGKHHNIIRNETSFFLGKSVGYIGIGNGFYDYEKLFDNLEFEILDGIGEGLFVSLYQYVDGERRKVQDNYVDYSVWNKLQYVVKKCQIKDYIIIVQNNILMLYFSEGLWFFDGDFSCERTEEIKEKVLERHEKEKIFLNLNNEYDWIYPVNASRFEQFIADLLDRRNPAARVRLVGKTNNADGGRDVMIIERIGERKRITLCQCKASAKSVNKAMVRDIRDTIEFYEADAYLLAVTSTITSQLMDHLDSVGKKKDVDSWTYREIFNMLKRYPSLAERYSDIIRVVK